MYRLPNRQVGRTAKMSIDDMTEEHLRQVCLLVQDGQRRTVAADVL